MKYFAKRKWYTLFRVKKYIKQNSSRTHVRLGAWFWSAQADIFFSESLHSTLRSGRRKTIVSQTMCALAEHLSQSEIELPLRNTCYYSPLAEVGVSTQTEMKSTNHFRSAKRSLPSFHFGFIALTPASYKSWSVSVRAKPCETQSLTQSLAQKWFVDFNLQYAKSPS